jgi:hypothetical protein
MWERVLDLSELSRLQPPSPLLSFMCAARRGPTTKSWLAPPIRARDQTGRQRPSLWPLDARWGQSNKSLAIGSGTGVGIVGVGFFFKKKVNPHTGTDMAGDGDNQASFSFPVQL